MISGLPPIMSGAEYKANAFAKAMDAVAGGTIYTDEQLKKMQETWGFTAEDIEFLRQEMLDTHPELRALADGFGLFDASAETLEDVYQKMQLVNDGVYSADTAFEEFQKPMYNCNEESKKFFEQLANGEVELNCFQTSLLESAGYSQEFINSVNGSVDGLEGFVSGVASAGVSAGTALVEGLQSSTAEMGASIAALGVQMATKAPEMSKQTNALGAAAIAGFNLGISQNETKTDATVQTWMSGAEKSMHDSAMKYGSPSKTAEGFGSDTVLGYNNGISKNVSKTINVIKSYMQTIQNTFRQIVTMLSDIGEQAIGALIEGLASKQSELKKTVEDITKTMEKAVTAASKVKMPSYSSSTTTASSIPQLATGAVIRGGNPFVAVLGDQPAGQTNIEAPLSTIKKALKEVMRENGGMGGEYTFVAQLNGKTLYKETVRQDQLFRKSTGKSRLGK